MENARSKKWGRGEFWGIDSNYDLDWVLTEEQKTLREKLIELCRVTIRPHAIHCDKTYEYPRKSLDALAELGILGLIVPKDLGGLGENHVAASMVVETIARYGCPSTALIYTMHVGAVASLLFRYHENPKLKDLLRRIDKDKLVGTLAYSDPATGGHYWYPLSSKMKVLDDNTVKILKYGSWATSAGCADWYTIQIVSPNSDGDYSNLSCFLVYKDEVRANTDEWKALGMHGNQSGPLIIEGTFGMDRLIGPIGDGKSNIEEVVAPVVLLLTACTWNGVSMASMDLAKKHVTRKAHADKGIRICDYPTIQDYFGSCLSSTSINRSFVFDLARIFDKETNNNDWTLYSDMTYSARSKYPHWIWIITHETSKNVEEVTDTMLHACGGSGFKMDLGLERLLRDGKAAWVMSPSSEVLRQLVGKTALMGFNSIDLWEQNVNERIVHHEISKMTVSDKKALAQKLMEEVVEEESGKKAHSFQDTDFENPFNTCPPRYVKETCETSDGKKHGPGLTPSKWTSLKLVSRHEVSKNMCSFVFTLPNDTDHTGCFPGQYIQAQVNINGKVHERYFSPVSKPDDYGKMELVLKFETQGIISNYFKNLKPGESVDVLGPCGGFEYEANKLDELTVLAAGGGITPGLQLIRCILNNPSDKTRVNLVYYSETYDDILYKEELDSYAAKDTRLRVFHTLGEVPENWEGEEGFIDTATIDKLVTKPNGIKHKIVMCGGPTMTISCVHSFRTLKFPSDMIFIYGQFGTELVRSVYGRNVQLSGHKCDNVV